MGRMKEGMGMSGNLGLSPLAGLGFRGNVVGEVTHAAFRPDGRHLLTLTSSTRKTDRPMDLADEEEAVAVRVWETTTGRPVAPPMWHEEPACPPVFSPDGRLLLCLSHGGAVLWDLRPQLPGPFLRHSLPVAQVRASPDGSRLATLSIRLPAKEGEETGREDLDFLKYPGAIPEGAVCEVRVWDVASGRSLLLPTTSCVQSIQLSDDGGRLLTACGSGEVRVWETATGRPLTRPLFHHGTIDSARLSPDGKRLLFLETGPGGQPSGGMPAPAGFGGGGPGAVGGLGAFGAYGALGALGAKGGHNALGALGAIGLGALGALGVQGGNGALGALGVQGGAPGLSPGKVTVLLSTVQVWDVDADRAVDPASSDESAKKPSEGVCGAWLSPDGRRLLALGEDSRIHVRDLASGEEVLPSLRPEGAPNQVVFSPNGERIVTLAPLPSTGMMKQETVVQLWDAATGEAVGPLHRYQTWAVETTFSADSRHVVLVGTHPLLRKPGTAHVLDAVTGEPVGRPYPGVQTACFGPDGHLLTLGREARVWDVERNEPVTPPLRHDGKVTHGAFHPEGWCVLTAGSDDLVRLWDTATGQPLGPPLPHHGPAGTAAFSPDGKQVWTLATPGGLQAWDLQPEDRPVADLLVLARAFSGREVDESGGMMSVEAEQFRHDLEALRQLLPLEISAPDTEGWHNREAAAALDTGDWSAAVFHLQRVLQARPDSAVDRAGRALAFARLGAWERAAADYGALDLGPRDGPRLSARGIAYLCLGQRREAADCFRAAAECPEASARTWADYALVALYAGDGPGYRRACATLLERFGKDPRAVALIQQTCTLGPDAVPDYGKVIRIGQPPLPPGVSLTLQQLAGGNPARLYRAGLFAEATQQALSLQPLPQLYATMAWHRLGKRDNAEKLFDAALSRAECVLYGEPEKDYTGQPLLWRDWLALELVCREAGVLIRGDAKGPSRD
jgi:WD40 repeat protein/tetratricopeptide (TPR) repeat protein